MKKLLLAVVMLLGTAPVFAAQAAMAELPVNARVRAMTYGYCLTNDKEGITHLLAERITFTGQYTPAQAQAAAAAWVADGYCQQTLASADGKMPGLRAAVVAALTAEGFTPSQPLTAQAIALDEGSKSLWSWLGKAFRAIGNALSGAFSAGGSGYYEYYENGQVKICDRQWHITVGHGGGAYEPTPFYPTPREGGD